MDVLDRHAELVRREINRKRAQVSLGHADDHVGRQAGELLQRTQTMASSGLVMQITKAFGGVPAMPAPTCSMTLRLMCSSLISSEIRIRWAVSTNDRISRFAPLDVLKNVSLTMKRLGCRCSG